MKKRKSATLSVNVWWNQKTGHIHVAAKDHFISTVNDADGSARRHTNLYWKLARCLEASGLPAPGVDERSSAEGRVVSLSQPYADRVESIEIWIPKTDASALPFVEGKRVPIKLEYGHRAFDAGLRATKRNEYVWICPDLREDGKRVRLADVLLPAIAVNSVIGLRLQDKKTLKILA
jgi:hypothetical protein